MRRGLSRKPFTFSPEANGVELDTPTSSSSSAVQVTSPENSITHVLVNPGSTVLWVKWSQDSALTDIVIPTAGSPQPAIPIQPGQSLAITLAPNSYFKTIAS